jgi:membrane associated rhomboid family serine protease
VSDPQPPILPPGFVRWESDGTPPPEFWMDEGDEEPDEPETVDLWRTVGGERPWATAVLLLSWCALFAVLGLRGETGHTSAYARWGASLTFVRGWGDWWRVLSYTFLHASIAHLALNGLTMLIVGPAAERVFTRAHFWLIFAGGGAVSAVASQTWRALPPHAAQSASVGASGAIFALGGALLAAAWRLRKRLPVSRARALAGALLPVLFQGFVAGFVHPGTDNAAHAGGLAAGLVLGASLPLDPRLTGRPLPRVTRLAGQAAAIALFAALAIAVASGLGLWG